MKKLGPLTLMVLAEVVLLVGVEVRYFVLVVGAAWSKGTKPDLHTMRFY